MSLRTIESFVEIHEDRRLVVQLPSDIPIGRHKVVTVLDDAPAATDRGDQQGMSGFPVIVNASWTADMPVTRAEMYDDLGR